MLLHRRNYINSCDALDAMEELCATDSESAAPRPAHKVQSKWMRGQTGAGTSLLLGDAECGALRP